MSTYFTPTSPQGLYFNATFSMRFSLVWTCNSLPGAFLSPSSALFFPKMAVYTCNISALFFGFCFSIIKHLLHFFTHLWIEWREGNVPLCLSLRHTPHLNPRSFDCKGTINRNLSKELKWKGGLLIWGSSRSPIPKVPTSSALINLIP